MKTLSAEGRRLLDSFEGLYERTPDGRYAAYLCPAGVPTIYNGLTEGVRLGMVISAEEGEAMFAAEIAKHEAAVNRLATVELSQNEFDALVLLSYNIGIAALEGSTALKRLNAGDRAGAAEAIKMWNKATVDGAKTVLPGLVSRREREAALFLKPETAPSAPYMPQEVIESVPLPEWLKLILQLASGGATGATLITFAEQIFAGVQAASSGVADFVVFAIANPVPAAAVAAGIALAAWPKIKGRIA